MASLALGVAGAAIGSFFGPLGTSIGWAIGSGIGGWLGAKDTQGPKLNDLKLQNASYGAAIPRGYGTKRIAGNVIDQSDLVPHEHESSGKGGPTVTTTSYSASILVQLADTSYIDGNGDLVNTPIIGIKRIWAAGRLIFGPGSPGTTIPMTVYLGTEDQPIDPVFEALRGVGNQPPYPGKAYVVFDDWDLTQFGNAIPPLEFEVQFTGSIELSYYSLWNVSWEYAENGSIYAHPTLLHGVDSTVPGQVILHRYRNGNAYGPTSGEDDDHTVYYDRRVYDLYGTLLEEDSQVEIPFAATGSPIAAFGSINNGIAYVEYSINAVDCSPYVEVDDPTGSNSTFVNTYAWLKDGVITFTLWTDLQKCANAFTSDPGIGAVWASYNGLSIFSLCYFNGYVYAIAAPDAGPCLVRRYPAPDGAVYESLHDAEYDLSLYSLDGYGSRPASIMVGNDGNIYVTISYSGSDPDVIGGAGTKLIKLDIDLNFIAAWYANNNAYPIGAASDNAGVEWNGYWIANHGNIAEYGGYNYAMYRMIPPGVGDNFGTMEFVDYIATDGIPDGDSPPSLLPTSPLVQLAGQPLAAFTGGILTLGNDYITLGEIVADISKQCGYASTEYDVSQLTDIVKGYVIADRMTGRAAIDVLRPIYQFGAVESDLTVKFRKWKGDVDVTIPDEDLGARPVNEDPVEVDEWTRALESELPQSIDFLYCNIDMDYQEGESIRQRQVTESDLHVVITAPVAMTPDEAAKSNDMLILNAWVERDKYRTPLPRKYSYLEPTDVVAVRGIARRLVNKEEQGYTHIIFDGVAAVTSVFVSAPTAVPPLGFVPQPVPIPNKTDTRLLDLPLITDDDFSLGYYAAMTGRMAGAWPGAILFKSIDGGVNYNSVGSTADPAGQGIATSTLGDFTGGEVFDEMNWVTVRMTPGSPQLSSSNELGVLNGANMAVLGTAANGWEVFQFKNAELVAETAGGSRTYELSGLLRGRRGSEQFIATHTFNEVFVLLPVFNVQGPGSELGAERLFKGITSGQTLASESAIAFTNNGLALKPYAPTELGGGRDGDGNITLTWVRRTRIGGSWVDNVDAPLSEDTESYGLYIYLDSTRTTISFILSTSSPTYTLSDTDQIAEWGSLQTTLYWAVWQNGSYGDGYLNDTGET